MKRFVKENRNYIIASILLIVVYFASRFVNLTDLPIFTDEAIYIRWAQIGSRDSSWRFISLTDGKQPLFVWAAMATVRLFSDPLFSGRIVSVLAGFLSIIGIGLLSYELFKSKRAGLCASFLYLFSPFALMYDRMALMDGMVAMFSIWSLLVAIMLVRKIRLDLSLIFGIVLGAGVLTKTSGFLNIYMIPALAILFDFKKKNWKTRLFQLIMLLLLAVIMSQVIYSVLRLSPWFHMIAQKNTTFIETSILTEDGQEAPFTSLLNYRSRFLVGNLRGQFDWLFTYMTLPIVLLVLFALVFIKKHGKEKLFLFVWFFAPFVALAFFGKVLYPRFILFMTMPLYVLASWSLAYIYEILEKKPLAFWVLAIFLFAYPAYVGFKILFSIVTAPIPFSDSGQYINDWPAGWGVRETVDFLEKESEKGELVVYTDGTFGLMPYGLEIYLVENPNIKIIGLWPSPEEYTKEMIYNISSYPTYFVSNQTQKLQAKWDARLIDQWQKGKRNDRFLRLYQLTYTSDEE